jgi:hypothetical protein
MGVKGLHTRPFGTGVVVSQLLGWFYDKIQMGFGMEVAQAGLATGVVVMLLIITSGIKVGRSVDRAIRKQESIFSKPVDGKLARFLIRIWGYEVKCQEEVEEIRIEAASGLDELGLTTRMQWTSSTKPETGQTARLYAGLAPITVKGNQGSTRDAFAG